MQINEAFELIKDDIKKVEAGLKEVLSSDALLISRVGHYILDSGGKRFRPLALLLSSKLCGYTGKSRIPLAVVVEFIHTATLLHDDVVDNAGLRRGNASANSVWGNETSVLVGDYLLAKAFAKAVEQQSMEVLEVLADTTTRMAEGEVLQLTAHSDTDITEEDYLRVITNKTAVLFSTSCRIPAILAGLDDEKKDALSTYGMELGIAYQLADDCLDYTSDDEELGKSIGNDLREGKVTLPLIRALSLAKKEEKQLLKAAIGDEGVATTRLSEVRAIIEKYKGIEYALESARTRIERAKECLDLFEPDMERAALSAVADYVIERTF